CGTPNWRRRGLRTFGATDAHRPAATPSYRARPSRRAFHFEHPENRDSRPNKIRHFCMQNPADIPEIGGEIPVKRRRYPRKSRVFQGLDLRTGRGRRIRSLHQGYAEEFDVRADESVPEQPIIQAAILRVAKLQVIVERLQDELLKPKNRKSTRLNSSHT